MGDFNLLGLLTYKIVLLKIAALAIGKLQSVKSLFWFEKIMTDAGELGLKAICGLDV